jgi:hypothetical protein
MESFIREKLGGKKPKIWVWSENADRNRTDGYLSMIPFVEFGGYFDARGWSDKGKQVFTHGNPWFEADWNGFDFLISFNKPLEDGARFETLLPDCEPNHKYEIAIPQEAVDFGIGHEKSVLIAMFNAGFYSRWLKMIGLRPVQMFLKRLVYRGFRPVLLGREWDTPFMSQLSMNGCLNLSGKTSFAQMLGLAKHAKAFFGFAAGNGILAHHIGCPTWLVWDMDQWTPGFAKNWVEPARLDVDYHPIDLRQVNFERIEEGICNAERL